MPVSHKQSATLRLAAGATGGGSLPGGLLERGDKMLSADHHLIILLRKARGIDLPRH